MTREFTCIICPNGCEIEAQIQNGVLVSMTGHTCPKGEAYVKQELTDPRRNIATSILVKGGELPLASVRLTNPIPKDRIFAAMEAIKEAGETPYVIGSVKAGEKGVILC